MINYENLVLGILLIPACYMWRNLYRTYHRLDEESEETKLFKKRHDCVVMYNRTDMCMRGWPPEYKIQISKDNLDRFAEPFVYFLKTAKSNLSIAMMRIAIPPLFDAIHEAISRGVEVKIIVNFLSIVNMKRRFQELLKAGAKVSCYVDRTEQLNQIMHCKYIVKDYALGQGYLCMGSMNVTSLSAIINNFEDFTFTSSKSAVHQFYDSFEKSFNMINLENNSNQYNKLVLQDAGLFE